MKRIFIALRIDPGVRLMKMISSFKNGLKNEKGRRGEWERLISCL